MGIKFISKSLVSALLFASLIYLNTTILKNTFFGWFIFVIFVLWTSKSVHIFFVKYFNLSRVLRIRILSVFLVVAVLGFVAGMMSWVYKITPTTLSFTFFIVGFISSCLKHCAGEDRGIIPEIIDDNKQVIEEVPSPKVALVLYFVLIFAGFYFLSNSQTGESVLTPWQTISVSYVYIFFAATLVLGLLIFSKLKSSTLIFLLVLHSLLLHAYLPLSHQFFYGADGWRHLGIQNSMLLNGVGKTLLFSVDPISFWQRFNFGSLAYAQFNSLALMFKMVCGLDFIIFLRYFIPVLWSVTLPILLYELARVLNWEKKRALMLGWLSLLPFALQVSGSFGLPSNLSFLFWLLILLLQFKNKQKFTWIGQITILILGITTLFGHSLYFILFGLSLVLFWLLDFSKNENKFKKIKTTVAVILSISLIPALELISHFSQFNFQINWWGQIKALMSSFSAWYVATGLRTSDITAGNIIFNQPSLNALVVNLFTIHRLWICVFMVMLWIVFVYGWYKILSKQKNSSSLIWLSLTVGLYAGYIISRYFLIGENILSRRLDSVLAILFILPVAYSLYEIIIVQKTILKQRAILFFIMFFCSLAITASYTLGPDIQTASQSQYLAADFIWQKTKNDTAHACVVSDTYTLLVLEGLSGKKIIGGGFPMNLYFTQPELNQLLKLAQTQPKEVLVQAKKLLNVDGCYLVGDYDFPDSIAKFGKVKIYNN